jgi:F-type H+-transporting ATPase subunit b
MAEPQLSTSVEHVPKGEHDGGLPQVARVIENRQKHLADDIAEAGRLKAQSDAAVAAYEKALADARARAQTIANETRDKQAAAAESTRKKLEEALNAKLADAEKAIAATKQSALGNVRAIAEDAARAIIERLIGVAPADKALADAVTEALKR